MEIAFLIPHKFDMDMYHIFIGRQGFRKLIYEDLKQPPAANGLFSLNIVRMYDVQYFSVGIICAHKVVPRIK